MKYLFKDVPDPEMEGGFFAKYIVGTSIFDATKKYHLEIDYDLCAPVETWTLTTHYIAVQNSIPYLSKHVQQVYHGKELTDEQRDMMVELVMENEYLDYGEFINTVPATSTNENSTTSL